jgi:S1-C subfamily serine protease
MKLTTIISALALTASSAFAWDLDDLNDHIEQTNFIVGNHCSGTLISLEHRLILTNHHCMGKYISTKTEKVRDKETNTISDVKFEVFKDVPLSQKKYQDHRVVGSRSYTSDIVDYNVDLDLALLQIVSTDLDQTRYAKIHPDYPQRGETVWAVGNPFMLDASVTKGVLSNTNRTVQVGFKEFPYYQIDAEIEGGSSGGSLYNDEGFLIGVPSAGAQGSSVGLAIPASRVRDFLTENCYEELWNEQAESYEVCIDLKKEKE